MQAGKLNRLVVIESRATTVDASGDRTDAWSTYVECWARIDGGAGREYWNARQTITDLSHTVTVRYYAGVTTDMRVRYDDPKTGASRYFNIRSVTNPDESDEMLVLRCGEVVV